MDGLTFFTLLLVRAKSETRSKKKECMLDAKNAVENEEKIINE